VKIVDVTEFYSERGGVRSHLDQKGRILRGLGHHHVILAPGARYEESELSGAEGRGSARVVRIAGPALPYDANYHLLWRLGDARRIAARESPDVLQLNSPYAAALAFARWSRTGTVKTFWWHADVIDTYLAEPLGHWLGAETTRRVVRPLWAWVRSIGRACDATFAASRQQADKLRAHGVPRVHRVPFGIDKRVFHPDRRSERWRAEMLAAEPARTIFVAMGRLSVEKQWPVLLEGFTRFRAERPAKLLIFGDGPERAHLERRFGDPSSVVFMGFERDRDKLATALASADAFIHGCPFETFGLSVAQAIACGSPIIVPDAGGAAELAHPSFAEVFTAGDAQALAAALLRHDERDWEALRSAALRGRESILDAVEQVERTVDVYRDLLAAGRRAGTSVGRGDDAPRARPAPS
jgi:alpha-1,6-mannosyltransferase